AHLRQNAFLADRCGPCVLHLHGADDGRSRSCLWRLTPDDYGRKERTKAGDPNRNRRGARPSTKTLHMSEAQPHATQTDAGQAAISEIRPQSSRRDFSLISGVRLLLRAPPSQRNKTMLIYRVPLLNEVFSSI